MAVLTFREALNQAMTEEMERDENVFLMGEEVAEYDGAYKVSQGMLKKFGPRRVVDTPISEEGFAGIGIGAAMVGLRPIIEFMTFSFSLVAIDQIVNNAANMRYMSGGQFAVPIVFRGSSGMAGCLAATHSHRLEAWYAQVPGLTVILPGTPADAKGLLKSAIRSDDPVVFIEHEVLYHEKGEVPEGEHLVPIGKADIKRPGSDVTLITYSRSLKATLAAADKLAEENISAEVIDLRTIRPLDLDTLLSSVTKTHRAVIVEEDWPYCGLGAGICRPDHPAHFRRARRSDPPRRLQGRADPVQPGTRSVDAAVGRSGRRGGPRCTCTSEGRRDVPIEVTMPKLSPTMETGVIAQWLVKVGDQVKEGDSLADIETDKATMPMKSYDDGTIVHIDHAAGDEVSLGQRVMVLAKKGEDPKKVVESLGLGQAQPAAGGKAEAAPAGAAAAAAPSHSTGNGQQAPAAEEQQPAGGRLKASPLARKVAASSQVELGQVRGSGPGGRIVRRDIEAFLQGEPKARRTAAATAPKPGGAAAPATRPASPPRRPAPLRPPSASRTRGCARRSPSACFRPSRPLPRSI